LTQRQSWWRNTIFSLSLLSLTELFVLASLQTSTSPEEVLQQIQQLLQRGQSSAARGQLADALSQFPNEPNLHNFLGVLEAQQGNSDAAESSFKKAVSLAPRLGSAYLNLGRLYQQQAPTNPKALEKGLQIYERLLQFQPANLEAQYQRAVLLQQLGHFKLSLMQLSRLPAEAQQRAQAVAVRCASHIALEELLPASQCVQRLLAASDLQEDDALALLSFSKQPPAPSLRKELLEGLRQRGLASSASLRQLALLYEEEKQLKQAREVLEKAAQGSSNLVELLLDLARIAHKQRDHQGALGYLAHARDLEPKNAAIHFFFGMVCIDSELVLEARKSLKEAVSLNPDNVYYNYALGSVLLQDRDPSLAIPYFQRYCQLKPDDPRGRFSLGTAYFYSADYSKARKELDSAAGHPETAAGAHYFLARVAKQEDKLDEAFAHLQQSLKANPNHAEAHAELGLVHIRNREFSKAEQELQLALRLDPESYLANLNLLNLFQRTRDPRSEEQAQRFEMIKKKRSERQQALLRTIEVRPY